MIFDKNRSFNDYIGHHILLYGETNTHFYAYRDPAGNTGYVNIIYRPADIPGNFKGQFAGSIGKYDGKLITCKAKDKVSWTSGSLHKNGHQYQGTVPCLMAIIII